MFFAVYSINVTWYGFYNMFEQVVSFRRYKHSEHLLPFKMSHHYQWVRDFTVKYWLRTFFLWVVGYYYAAAVAFTVPFYSFGETPDANGKQVGMWTVGMMIYLLCVFLCHFLFFTFFRDFNRTVVIIGCIIWV